MHPASQRACLEAHRNHQRRIQTSEKQSAQHAQIEPPRWYVVPPLFLHRFYASDFSLSASPGYCWLPHRWPTPGTASANDSAIPLLCFAPFRRCSPRSHATKPSADLLRWLVQFRRNFSPWRPAASAKPVEGRARPRYSPLHLPRRSLRAATIMRRHHRPQTRTLRGRHQAFPRHRLPQSICQRPDRSPAR